MFLKDYYRHFVAYLLWLDDVNVKVVQHQGLVNFNAKVSTNSNYIDDVTYRFNRYFNRQSNIDDFIRRLGECQINNKWSLDYGSCETSNLDFEVTQSNNTTTLIASDIVFNMMAVGNSPVISRHQRARYNSDTADIPVYSVSLEIKIIKKKDYYIVTGYIGGSFIDETTYDVVKL